MKYYKTKKEALDWIDHTHVIKYKSGKGYYLQYDEEKHNEWIKRMDQIQEGLKRQHRNEVAWCRRHGIINNHLCSGCERIVGNGRTVCCACIDKAINNYYKNKKKNIKNTKNFK